MEADGEDEDTQPEIDELFAAHEPPPELPAWDAFMRGASTGIPQGEEMPQPTPTPTPAAEMSESERRVNPEYSGRDYDGVHATFLKDSKKFLDEWPKKQRNHDVNIKKVANHGMCSGSPAVQTAKDHFAACEREFIDVQRVATNNLSRGKNYVSKAELKDCTDTIERCRNREAELANLMKPLLQLAMLPDLAKK